HKNGHHFLAVVTVMRSENRIAFADQYHLGIDTRFHFIFPIPIQNVEEQTPLLGFTEDVMEAIFALHKILMLPQHPNEISAAKRLVLAMRMSGETFHLRTIPTIGLPHIRFDQRTPLVCFVTNKRTCLQICDYQKDVPFPTLHISSNEQNGVLPISDIGL